MTATILVLAHFGHWYISLPVFMSPVLAVLALVLIERWRDRRNPDRHRDKES